MKDSELIEIEGATKEECNVSLDGGDKEPTRSESYMKDIELIEIENFIQKLTLFERMDHTHLRGQQIQ